MLESLHLIHDNSTCSCDSLLLCFSVEHSRYRFKEHGSDDMQSNPVWMDIHSDAHGRPDRPKSDIRPDHGPVPKQRSVKLHTPSFSTCQRKYCWCSHLRESIIVSYILWVVMLPGTITSQCARFTFLLRRPNGIEKQIPSPVLGFLLASNE